MTRNRLDSREIEDRVEVPLYHLAEWVAENWWSLLFEPQKNEDSEAENAFRERHWLGTARRGFALPDVWLNPVGDAVSVVANPCNLRQAGVHFLEEYSALVPLDQVRSVLTHFVDATVAKLRERSVIGTDLEETWDRVTGTPPDAEVFCRCMGALGLSPYEEHPRVEAILDELTEKLPTSLVLEICQAADAGNLKATADAAALAQKSLDSAASLDLSAVKDIVLPADRPTLEAWHHGVQSARKVRTVLGISQDDPCGVDRLFDRLHYNPNAVSPALPPESVPNLNGAVDREDDNFRVAVIEGRPAQRRFSGTRGIFLAWSSDRKARKLLTSARTRDQQASRAFAAELCAPIGWIRQHARNGRLTSYDIEELAEDLNISGFVVFNQARNNGLDVVRY